MYAPDGRVITIGENRVEEYKKVGWYTNKATADKYKPVYYENSSILDFSWITGVPLKKSEIIADENSMVYTYYYDCSFEGANFAGEGSAADRYLTALEESGAIYTDSFETPTTFGISYDKGLNTIMLVAYYTGTIAVVWK